MRYLLCFITTSLVFFCSYSRAGQTTSDALPPPGEYQIDSVTTMHVRSPGEVIERVDKTDGATGNTISTQKSSSLAKPVVTTIPGKGPVRYCQGVRGSTTQPSNCRAKSESTANTFSADIACAEHTTAFDFRKIGNGVWEKRVKITPATNAMRSIPPQAQAAMAEMISKMQERLKVAPPQEAAEIRQQMQMFQQNQMPASPVPETETVETWTYLSAKCSG